VSIDGRRVAPSTEGNVWLNQIGPRFFETLGTPLLGRDFSAHDNEGAAKVAIVSEALAREFFPDQNAIGHRIQVGKSPPAEIIGVVKTMKYETLREAPHYILFEPYLQSLDNAGAVYLEIRSAGSLGQLGSVIRRQIAAIAPQAPAETFTLDSWVNQFLTADRTITAIAGVFGILAILLAAVGLYGVMAYSVAQRTHEIGIRVALGAQRSNILAMVLSRGLRITLAGVGIGIGVALALTRLLASLLYGVKPTDALTLAVASCLLLAVALLACYVPARRAARVDPMVALRHE
jgi:predicted permease